MKYFFWESSGEKVTYYRVWSDLVFSGVVLAGAISIGVKVLEKILVLFQFLFLKGFSVYEILLKMNIIIMGRKNKYKIIYLWHHQ